MNPYTAGDSLNVITRAQSGGSTTGARDWLSLAAHRTRRITAADLRHLYDRAGIAAPANGNLAAAVTAGPAIGAWDGEQLVGFIRAVSDGHLVAYVEDVVIDRGYREHGLSNALTTRLLAELKDVAVVHLRGGAGAISYYERQGFQPTPTVLLQRQQAA